MTETVPTKEEINRRIDKLAEKRNRAADVMKNPLLAWSYQVEINELLVKYKEILD